mmetsp:Transcript_60836/g.139493  ORF Transcript_60836/g.139493 Transcript_60836/m.139493 type:complete len:348 (-) Transcript_60836:542-1585(-)
MVLHLRVVRDDHKIDLRLELRQESLVVEQFHQHAIAEAEAAGWHVGREARVVQREQLVVPAAAANGAQLALSVEALKDDAGVVREASDNRRVKHEEVGESVRLRLLEELGHIADRLRARVPNELLELRHRAEGERGDDLAGGLLSDVLGHEQLYNGLGADLVELVDDDAHLGKLGVVGDSVQLEGGGEYLARVDLDADVVCGDAHRLEESGHRREQLHLSGNARLANDVHVPLEVLALAPTLHCLEAPALRDGEPFDWEQLLAAEREDHTRERWRHLGTQSHRLAVLVDEVVHLLRDLLTSLALVQLLVLEYGRVVLYEGQLARGLAEAAEEPAAQAHLVGEEIARA